MTALLSPWMYVSLAHLVVIIGTWRMYWGCWLPWRQSDFATKCTTRTDRQDRVCLYAAVLILSVTLPFAMYEPFREPTEQEQTRAVWNGPEWQQLADGVFKLPASRTKRCGRIVVAREDFPVILGRFVAKHPELEVMNVSAVMGADGNGSMYEDHYIVTTRPRK
ncbi:MAG: hypothetical protein K2W95_24695 [Candidatus Obscuribacterales bacterium]|nr:hypothetical protein [Candidatus Obscuribacterales bacterium]